MDDDTHCVDSHRVVVAMLRRGDEVLLCHRSPDRQWYPNVWDFPGGHVEDGEQPKQALRREILEEIGVDVRAVKGPPLLELSDPVTGFDQSLWLVEEWSGHVENLQPREHDEIGWFRSADVRNLTLAHEAYGGLLAGILSDSSRPRSSGPSPGAWSVP